MTSRFQRDVFIDEIRKAAVRDRDVYFISADFGAPALDQFRTEFPHQFIHAGISEQNMIDMAAGIALTGKKVYVYAMAPFITLRCLEQLKCAIALMNLPVTVLAVGVGLGYADAGPTHYTTEDVACMRSLIGVEVYSPGDDESAHEIAKLSYTSPAFRIIRLDRNALPTIYSRGFAEHMNKGFVELTKGEGVCILSYGYMLHRAMTVQRELATRGVRCGVIDVFRIKPIDTDLLNAIAKYDSLVTVEEQCLSGGFGSSILEACADGNVQRRFYRLGLAEKYCYENGGRDYLLDHLGLSTDAIAEVVEKAAAENVRYIHR
jgi:transketolase